MNLPKEFMEGNVVRMAIAKNVTSTKRFILELQVAQKNCLFFNYMIMHLDQLAEHFWGSSCSSLVVVTSAFVTRAPRRRTATLCAIGAARGGRHTAVVFDDQRESAQLVETEYKSYSSSNSGLKNSLYRRIGTKLYRAKKFQANNYDRSLWKICDTNKHV